MDNQDYTVSFLVNETPETIFNAINNVRGWWSEAVEGYTDQTGAVFYYAYENMHHCTIKIEELVPEKKVVWHVLHNYFNFIDDRKEWVGTDIVFEIHTIGDKTEVRFTHVGLVPDNSCYSICSDAWKTYITGSLKDLIQTGTGRPNPIREIVTRVGNYLVSPK